MAAMFHYHWFDFKLDITKHCCIIIRYVLSILGSCRNTDFVLFRSWCYCFTFLICDSKQKHFLVALSAAVPSMTEYKLCVNLDWLLQMTFESKEARSIPGILYLELIQLIHRVWALMQPTHSVWYSWKGVNCNSRFRQLSVQESMKTSDICMWNIWQTDHSTHEDSASLTCNRLQVELGAGFIVTVDVQERCGFVTRVLPWSKYIMFTVWWSDLAEKSTNALSCEFTGGNTLTNVMPTTSPLLGGDLLKASIDTISASTALRKKIWISIWIIYQIRHKERLRI